LRWGDSRGSFGAQRWWSAGQGSTKRVGYDDSRQRFGSLGNLYRIPVFFCIIVIESCSLLAQGIIGSSVHVGEWSADTENTEGLGYLVLPFLAFL